MYARKTRINKTSTVERVLEITSDNNVQSLETLGKLKDVTGNVRSVLDKLKGVKADLGTDNAGKQGAKILRSRKKHFVQTKQRHHKEGLSTVTQLTPEL